MFQDIASKEIFYANKIRVYSTKNKTKTQTQYRDRVKRR